MYVAKKMNLNSDKCIFGTFSFNTIFYDKAKAFLMLIFVLLINRA